MSTAAVASQIASFDPRQRVRANLASRLAGTSLGNINLHPRSLRRLNTVSAGGAEGATRTGQRAGARRLPNNQVPGKLVPGDSNALGFDDK
ncbi:hypothetical protein EJB06_31430 [Massilia atriviolacea]|uniref:Uncharacterized protein n=1 Tax=Massilia atriviolacea TaxID=2495579 RepID=A0A430HC12_9BURK|nr:hypothetical protein EJB06_31430 [Massilia atriviolacea]